MSLISIVDVGIGNTKSIHKALLQAGGSATYATTPQQVTQAEKLILPGVGHFKAAKDRLKLLGLYGALDRAVTEQKTPILGICLGMQLMCDRSEEGNERGFGWIAADVVKFKFPDAEPRKVPHICWSYVNVVRRGQLLRNVGDQPEYYFIHSFHLAAASDEQVIATAEYGYGFPALVEHEHVYGTQFHPEKSGAAGLTVLRNFIEI